MIMKKAVILLSGGLDSATCLAIAKQDGYELHALSFNYGQRHKFEIEAAKSVAKSIGAKNHINLTIDLRAFGGSALTDDIEVPKERDANQISDEIPITYVPARNTIFLSFGLAFAETIKSNDIFIGVNALDYSGYPDCRPEYIESFEKMAQLATQSGIEKNNQITIHTPLIQLTKAEIIKTGLALGVNYGITHSCYDPVDKGNPCRACDACQIRLKGFLDAGLSDPLVYNK
jgi:7-cyano-7-deazaguanine synthase